MKNSRRQLRQRAKLWLGQTERLYPLYLKWRNPKKRFPCRDTFLTIEGFPRSANTFSWYLAREVFPGKLISSHIHNIASIKAGLRLGRPCVIVFRAPFASVVSLAQMNGIAPEDEVGLEGYLREWCQMHEFVLQNRDRLTLVEFSQAVDDPPAFARLLASLAGSEMDYETAASIAAASRAKMEASEGKKSKTVSSLPREERQQEKAAYIAGVQDLPSASAAEALFRRLGDVKIDLRVHSRAE